jgi:hypothetical protein
MTDNKIQIARLFENESKAGNRYYIGLLNGSTKLLMLKNARAQEGEPDWNLFILPHERQAKTPPQAERQSADQAPFDPIEEPAQPGAVS